MPTTISLDPTTTTDPNAAVTVTGSGFASKQRVRLRTDGYGTSVYRHRAGKLGAFIVGAPPPVPAAIGTHKVEVLDDAAKVVLATATYAITKVVVTPPPPPPPPPPLTGFVARQGAQIMLDGAPYRFSGLNIYHANGRNNCWQPPLGNTDGALAAELDRVPGNAFRAWFFQGLATTNGVCDWAAFDHTLAVAKAKGRKVVAVLTGEGGCGDPGLHRQPWYATDYRTIVQAEHIVPYRTWVAEVVARYRDDPTVLMWQIGNELEIKVDDATCGTPATLLAFVNDMAALIKSIDPRHLVCPGVVGSGQCGTSDTDYVKLHESPSVDVCSYHYYPGPPYPSFPGDQHNGLQTRLSQAAALGKPLVVTEMGLRLGDFGGDRQARAAKLSAVIAEQRAAGIAGHLPWAWCPPSQAPYEDYLYTVGDPALTALV